MKLHTIVAAAAVALAAIGAHATSNAPSKDIVDTAVEAGSFKTLAAALQAADLVITLRGEGPFTVFAPTDAAFAKIPKADLDALLEDKQALTKVLTYHVVPGEGDGRRRNEDHASKNGGRLDHQNQGRGRQGDDQQRAKSPRRTLLRPTA